MLVFEGEEHWLTGSHRPGPVSVHDQIRDSGAPDLLLERYAGRLEYHEPWHVGREVSHLLRGQVDVEEVDRLLAAEGHEDLRLVDNGVVHRRSPALAGLDHVRSYHLLPAGARRRRWASRRIRRRGGCTGRRRSASGTRGRTSGSRATSASSGWWRTLSYATRRCVAAIAGRPNVRVAEGAHGQGVYEAVVTTLMRRR